MLILLKCLTTLLIEIDSGGNRQVGDERLFLFNSHSSMKELFG